jgi:hypothetical protein
MVSLKQFKHFWLCYFLQVCDVSHHCHHMNKLISFSGLQPSRPTALESMTLKLGCHFYVLHCHSSLLIVPLMAFVILNII